MLPANWSAIGIGRHAAQAVIVLRSRAVPAALAAGIRGGHREIFFGPLWYLISLNHHRSDYYLTVPAIGWAITAAQGFFFSSSGTWNWCAPAIAAIHAERVYLAPAAADTVHPAFYARLLERVVMEPPVLPRAPLGDLAMIYSVTADHLRNVTETFRRRITDEVPDTALRRIEVGDPLFAFATGPESGPVESDFRRIPARASLPLVAPRLGAPGNRHFLGLEGAV